MKNNDSILNKFLLDGFNLKAHLVEFIPIDPSKLDMFLENAKIELANLHPGDNSVDSSDFYEEIVGDKHLADLAAWHLTSKHYIYQTLELQQRFSKDLVLDFGGGIGTHALANAMSNNVEHVFFVDINKTNRDFVEFRAKELGVEGKITFFKSIDDTKIKKFDSITCLDVLEHLPDPSSQLDIFHSVMSKDAIALFNWYFYKGENNEYPFHLDDQEIVNEFFRVLQYKFIEVFHPLLITTRTYKKSI